MKWNKSFSAKWASHGSDDAENVKGLGGRGTLTLARSRPE